MAQVIWRQSALDDLQEIVNYVTQHAPTRAAALAARLTQATRPLRSSPGMGRAVPECGQDDIREIVSVRPYRILYVVRDNDCHVVHIFHGRRDLRAFLRPEDFEDIP